MTTDSSDIRVKELFNDALELDAHERLAYVERATDDERVRIDVRGMIEAHERAGRFLADPDIDGAERPGERIGRYRLLSLIGEGGFGSVYRAEQLEPISRTVALKIIKLGMDTRQVIARFETERQALAMMDHRSIASVFDAGATMTGRPYFVMELVDGIALTEYCDRHRLSVVQRIDLFRQVCSAVQHAHTKGVIHRDIKPGNVLVNHGVNGDAPCPKVIDFGIAKSISPRPTGMTALTERSHFVGTPEYMSPEQADATTADIDTRADIYSLGVLLYELLTGVTPFDGKRLRSSTFGELQRIIREEEPPKPSTRVSSLHALPTVATARAADPGRLTSMLRGDLDWITLKALEKNRERRYDSAAELADDLQRHLNHEPVSAGPPNKVYRIKKFVRRNRTVVISVAAIFVVLVLGIIATSLALVRAANETRTSAQVAQFIQQMLSGIDPQVARGRDTLLLKKIFDDSAQRIETELADQPQVQATIRTTIGRAYLAVGEPAKAEEQLTAALELRRGIFGEEHPDSLQVLAYLGESYRKLGQYDRAEASTRTALETRRRVLGNDHPDTLWSINVMGNLMGDMGRYNEEETYTREAMDGRRRVLGDDHPETLMSVHNMGSAMLDLGRFAEAEGYYRQSLEGQRRVLGEGHPHTLASMANLGRSLRQQKEFSEAETLAQQAIDANRRVMGEDHPITLAYMNSLGALLMEQGKYADAETCFRDLLDRRRRVLGNQHPETLLSINNLGAVLNRQGKPGDAQPFYQEALELNRRILGEDHPDTLRSLHNMGALLRRQGRLTECAEHYNAALEGRRRVLGAGHSDTVVTMDSLASVHLMRGPDEVYDPARALELAQEANVITKFVVPGYLATLAAAYHQSGQHEQAIDMQQKAIESLPANSPLLAEYQKSLGEFEAARDKDPS